MNRSAGSVQCVPTTEQPRASAGLSMLDLASIQTRNRSRASNMSTSNASACIRADADDAPFVCSRKSWIGAQCPTNFTCVEDSSHGQPYHPPFPTTPKHAHASVRAAWSRVDWQVGGVLAARTAFTVSAGSEGCGASAHRRFDFIGFDHLGLALLTNFQIISLEGWTDIMYLYMDAGYWWAWM